jgi:small subunit ribosomal protein S20
MPNIKSAKKRVISSKKRNENNSILKTTMKTMIRNVDKLVAAGDKEAATTALLATIKKIDKACAKGLVHRNTAARYKSRLTKNVNSMK